MSYRLEYSSKPKANGRGIVEGPIVLYDDNGKLVFSDIVALSKKRAQDTLIKEVAGLT